MEIIGWLVDNLESSTQEILEQNHEVWGDIRIGLLRDGLEEESANVLPQCCYLTWDS